MGSNYGQIGNNARQNQRGNKSSCQANAQGTEAARLWILMLAVGRFLMNLAVTIDVSSLRARTRTDGNADCARRVGRRHIASRNHQPQQHRDRNQRE